jgi:hypothetical protein
MNAPITVPSKLRYRTSSAAGSRAAPRPARRSGELMTLVAGEIHTQ